MNRIKTLQADGYSDFGIASELNFDGVRCPYGERWTPVHVRTHAAKPPPTPPKPTVRRPAPPKPPTLVEENIYQDSNGLFFYKSEGKTGAKFKTLKGARDALKRTQTAVRVQPRGIAPGIRITSLGRYTASLKRAGHPTHLGTFSTFEEARAVRDEAVKNTPKKESGRPGTTGVKGITETKYGFVVLVKVKSGRRKRVGAYKTLAEAKRELVKAKKREGVK